MKENDISSPEQRFSWRAAGAISISIVAFLVIFQPFGLSLENGAAILVIAGLAPLNFAALILAHSAQLPRGPTRALITTIMMVGLNYAYLALFSGPAMSLGLRVVLVGAGVVVAVAAWRQHENLKHEVISLRKGPRQKRQDIVLRGEGEGEVLKIPRASLRYAKAEGNYTCVAWIGPGSLSERLLRTTLKDVESAAGGALIRCHRSYLVNLDEAERIEGNSKGLTVHFADGAKTPVSRNYVAAIRSAVVSIST